ncbi:pheromone A receptor-domain-containing protein [Xylariomycetidae sp. FL2044]|nr:pheromone A receptor-domain-containing protein [Xylariomycetidae sp. FL2044]
MEMAPSHIMMYAADQLPPTPTSIETDPRITVDLIFRVFLATILTLLTWVPFKLLYQNGEFPALVLIADVFVFNLTTVVNALIWHSDDYRLWWDGAGLCDVEVYLRAPMGTVYAASIFTIMYYLADTLKHMRVNRLDRQERRRRNWIQATIIFPVPIFQLLFTWFDLSQRYNIGTLSGCTPSFDSSWPKTVIIDIPPGQPDGSNKCADLDLYRPNLQALQGHQSDDERGPPMQRGCFIPNK